MAPQPKQAKGKTGGDTKAVATASKGASDNKKRVVKPGGKGLF